MKNYLQKKAGGFWLTLVAAVLSIIGAVIYMGFQRMQTGALMLVVAAIVVEIIYIVISGIAGNKPVFNLAATLCALLTAAGIMVSMPNQIDGFGFLVAGLFTFDDVRGGVFFLIFAILALVLDMIAAFTNLGKD